MSNFNNSIKEILKFAFSDAEDLPENISSDFIQVLNLKKNTIFIQSNDELKYIFILVKGLTYVAKYTPDGRRIIADTFTEPQIFGLIEAINGVSNYKGTVITLSDSILVKINKGKFLEAVYSNIDISAYMIRYLAGFSTHSIETSEFKSSISQYENLIIYFYNKTLGKKLPYRIKENKAFISDSLQINKRTLYRYLNRLSDEGIISRDKQDIIIYENNFRKIEKLFISVKNL